MGFEISDIVIYTPTGERFEIEGISLSGKYFLKLPGRMDKHRHARIPQPVNRRDIHKLFEKTEKQFA
jgi:hypothetical protein